MIGISLESCSGQAYLIGMHYQAFECVTGCIIVHDIDPLVLISDLKLNTLYMNWEYVKLIIIHINLIHMPSHTIIRLIQFFEA